MCGQGSLDPSHGLLLLRGGYGGGFRKYANTRCNGTLALRKLKQENHELVASLGYIENSFREITQRIPCGQMVSA